eukprot:SAG11_NODE_2803_length_2954_cov_1.849737_2_plen_333_part_00
MVQGAELTLNSVRAANLSADRETKFFDALDEDNSINLVTCNFGSIGGEPAGGSGCTGSRRRHCSPALSAAPHAPTAPVLVEVNITAYREERQTGGVWSTNMDFLSRKPFQYQPLCYEEARTAHSAAGVAPPPAPAPGAPGPVVKVAVLQMNSVAVPLGQDPVPAHMERATLFVRQAKKQGADVAVFPEQWSVGYSRNYDKAHYGDLDSARTVYEGYVKWAQKKDGPYVTHFQDLAKELGIAIAAAYTQNVDGETGWPQDRLPPRNSVAVIDRHGALLHSFSKVHIAWDGTTSTDCEGITQAGRSFYTHALDLGGGRGSVSVVRLTAAMLSNC